MSFAQCADNGAELLAIGSLPLPAIGQYLAHAVGAASRYIGKIPCCVTLAVPSVGIVDAAHYESVVVAVQQLVTLDAKARQFIGHLPLSEIKLAGSRVGHRSHVWLITALGG